MVQSDSWYCNQYYAAPAEAEKVVAEMDAEGALVTATDKL